MEAPAPGAAPPLELLQPEAGAGCPPRRAFVRGGALHRPGLSAGDVIALVDPATRQPYGVVRVPLGSAAADDNNSAGGGGEGDAYVLALLNAAAPGFARGSCWLEVFTAAGGHIGLRSAAAGGLFLQARRRGGGGGGCGGGDSAPPASAAADPCLQKEGSEEEAAAPSAAAAAAAAATEAASSGGPPADGFARRLVRNSRLAFSSLNLGVYEQFEVLPPAAAAAGAAAAADDNGEPCSETEGEGGAAALLAQPWQRVRVALRSRLLPHVRLEVEVRFRWACLYAASSCMSHGSMVPTALTVLPDGGGPPCAHALQPHERTQMARVGALIEPRRVPSPPCMCSYCNAKPHTIHTRKNHRWCALARSLSPVACPRRRGACRWACRPATMEMSARLSHALKPLCCSSGEAHTLSACLSYMHLSSLHLSGSCLVISEAPNAFSRVEFTGCTAT